MTVAIQIIELKDCLWWSFFLCVQILLIMMNFNLRERLTDGLDLPLEVAQNLSRISITGEKELFIENYRGVIEYTSEVVRVRTLGRVLRVEGTCLEIRTVTDDDLQVVGCINSACYI